VLTPAWRVFTCADEVSAASVAGLRFPIIVKPVAEDSSLGIDSCAVASDLDALRARVVQVTACYRQPALAEQFVEGREFNAGLWGDPPQLLPLAEVDLSALGAPEKRIVTYAAKWEEESFEYGHTPVTCPAVVSDALAARIRSAALQAWNAIGSRRAYGRVDMRVYGNPSIAKDAGFARAARAAGLDYALMILTILSSTGVNLHDYDKNG
jgi:D-alanine-D-alanine ligase